MSKQRQDFQPKIIFEKPEKISPPTLERIKKITNVFTEKFNYRSPLERIEVHFEQVKKSLKRPSSFMTTLKVKLFNGNNLYSKSENKSAITSLHLAIKKIVNQYRSKNHKSY